jgi:HD superfamily phosphodiesterase/predicted RNA-binding Zn-ribbon protein involved in translation (DUF1610 family)
MDHQFCPGSKLLRQPAPEMFSCPSCGEEVEIWTDEFKRDCLKCGETVYRDKTMSCLDWCKHGKDCVGDAIYEQYQENKAMGMKFQLQEKLKKHFGTDTKRIAHAKMVMKFAEELLTEEKADWHIVIPASILHDVGIKAAEEKYGSYTPEQQEEEGPPIANEILRKLGFAKEDISEICNIIAHHHSPGEDESINFRVLFDADQMVNMEKYAVGRDTDELRRYVDDLFLTKAGKQLAIMMYAKEEVHSL